MARRSPEPVSALEVRLVAAALSLGDSLDAIAMPELAKASGLAVGTLYRLAPGKVALAELVTRAVRARFDAVVFAPFPARLDLKGRFDTIWQRLSQFLLDEPDAARHLAVRALPEGSAFRKASAAFARDGAALGALRDMDADTLAALVWGPVAAMARDGTASSERLADLGQAVWAGLLRPPARSSSS